MTKALLRRVLTLDLRSKRFGYVVFEGPHTLLDWGTRTYGDEERSSLDWRLKNLQSSFAPSVILARQITERHRFTQPTRRRAFHSLKALAKRMLITVHLIDESKLRGFFSRETKVNKHDIAQMIAGRFPELSWQLPPKRKPWQSEPTRQSIFDAASLGVFYFAQLMKTPPNLTPTPR
jgi:hypothetical protein